ncbi:MAG: hypothetical protein H7Y31_09245 [Chitinophagaceae bacterium]|nr:hypothetical protein [Chitinophagaceae bacterium]
MKKISLWSLSFTAMVMLAITSCQKNNESDQSGTDENIHQLNTDEEFKTAYQEPTTGPDQLHHESRGFSLITFLQLLEARAATAKYRDFDRAIADGYADINVVVPNMGYHFLKDSINDATFEIRKPEILVYNKKRNGKFELVAVEYAVPINDSPNAAPEGFSGSADVWERNESFGLWLLHAWIWEFNPDGIFHHTNRFVVVR